MYLVSSCQNESNKTQEKATNLNIKQNSRIHPHWINALFDAHIIGRLLEEIGEEYHTQEEHHPCHYAQAKWNSGGDVGNLPAENPPEQKSGGDAEDELDC